MTYQDGLLTMDTPLGPAPVPEPASLLILGAALVLAYLVSRAWWRRPPPVDAQRFETVEFTRGLERLLARQEDARRRAAR